MRDGEKAVGRVVVVVPAYNEERFIASVVFNARSYAERVVVVDDGSVDRTARLAEQAGAEVVKLAKNSGKAQALNAGFSYARRLKPDVVVIMDGDAQHDAADIPAVVEPILAGQADVSVGSRFLGEKHSIPAWRRFGQHALNIATSTTSGVALTDSQSGFRAFSGKALEVLRFNSKGLGVESEMQFLLKANALRVVEVPIRVHYLDGNKRNPFLHGVNVLDSILNLVAKRRPLLFFSFPGAVMTIGGVLLGFRVLVAVTARHPLPVGTAVLTTLLIVVGMLFIITGLMLNTVMSTISRLIDEMDRRSQVIDPATLREIQ